MSSEDEKLVQSSADITANLVVAQDGTGNYSTISDAIKVVPNNSESRFIIYVKKGVYFENVKIGLDQWNVMMFGDGMNDTIVSGNLSNADGLGTTSTATFAVLGQGFIARDMGFANTAGPIKHQAVALLSASDQSVFYRCRMDGYQDTLYVKSNRQLYRECHILGTIDFIFGNAATVIQNCTILAKRPLQGQSNAITAHSGTDPNCPTGIAIQICDIVPAEDLTGVRTYLGRLWKNYSTTVFMQNNMGISISPEGWVSMAKAVGAPPPPDTIFLAEYDNRGPGANVADRVKWNGVRTNLSRAEADKYTVHSLISGDEWLPATKVSFLSGLL
ncbi:putative pectinesterase/pectinesterase inhibitor 24 [Phtheirospermum japonicum]|uniref:Pectinesterase n=1 Tax=Phtheirospermum japonicum TaxID=374723 RepID=A0A830B2K4_9LAMI|nr:putative pectinesterase/pectinesterase inhibitor 24 [Phtheirospermum japonicum]